MTGTFKHKGFIGTIEFSEEDGVYYGKIEVIKGLVNYEGETVEELETAFQKAVDDYIDFCSDNRLTPSRAIHPGEILREELEARDIKQKDFAELIGMRPSHLNDFLKGRRNMTEGFAKKLENALVTPAETWMRLHYFYLHDLKTIAECSVGFPHRLGALPLQRT